MYWNVRIAEMCTYMMELLEFWQAKRTKKVGITGKYGTRYGASLRKMVKKMEITQHSKYTCSFCGKVNLSSFSQAEKNFINFLLEVLKSMFQRDKGSCVAFIFCITNTFVNFIFQVWYKQITRQDNISIMFYFCV